jgi:hypothetical protein
MLDSDKQASYSILPVSFGDEKSFITLIPNCLGNGSFCAETRVMEMIVNLNRFLPWTPYSDW